MLRAFLLLLVCVQLSSLASLLTGTKTLLLADCLHLDSSDVQDLVAVHEHATYNSAGVILQRYGS